MKIFLEIDKIKSSTLGVFSYHLYDDISIILIDKHQDSEIVFISNKIDSTGELIGSILKKSIHSRIK